MRPANAYPVLIQKTAVQVSAKLSLVDGRFLFSFLFLDRVDVICGHSPKIQIILLLSEDRFLGYRPSYFYLRIPSEDVDHPTSIWGYRSSYFHMRIFFFWGYGSSCFSLRIPSKTDPASVVFLDGGMHSTEMCHSCVTSFEITV